MKPKIFKLIDKYNRYVANINWHIATNQVKGNDLVEQQKRLSYYQEILLDLKSLI